MKFFKIILIFICLSGCSSLQIQKTGFDITFHNDTSGLACYLLQWLSHALPQQGPASMCGGELKPGASNDVNNGYRPGLWVINWYSCRDSEWSETRPLIVSEDIHHIKTTPFKDTLK